VQQLAYEFAKTNNIVNEFDNQSMAAGEDWLALFLNRHKNILLKKPEGLSWFSNTNE